MILESERLKIIPLDLNQLKLLLDGTPSMEHELGLNPSRQELDVHTREAMAYLYDLARATPNFYPWITNWQIILASANISIGSLCFMNIPDESGSVETGYGIYPEFQHQGYMTEALRCVCHWAFKQPNIKRILAESNPDNTPSHRVLEKCGFKQISATQWSYPRQSTVSCRKVTAGELNIALFAHFNRYQKVTKCWRSENNARVLKDIAFMEEWSPENYSFLVKCLRHTIDSGGTVWSAWDDERLIGFASIESMRRGSRKQYLQLSSIHVSAEYRGRGIGQILFRAIVETAREMNAQKLYISAHSSEETQSFYRAMGCTNAEETMADLVAEEPFDCQLEYVLKPSAVPVL